MNKRPDNGVPLFGFCCGDPRVGCHQFVILIDISDRLTPLRFEPRVVDGETCHKWHDRIGHKTSVQQEIARWMQGILSKKHDGSRWKML